MASNILFLFETIRLNNGVVYFVSYHQQRIDRSIGNGKIDLLYYVNNIELPQKGCFKLRITYTNQGIIEHAITPYLIRPIKTLRVIVDNVINYDCKWNDRTDIEHLFNRRDGCDDIIIVRNGVVTDSSFANIILFDGQKWITPIEPLLAGTCRARLIEHQIIVPQSVSVEMIMNFPKIMLINAMMDFDVDRIVDVSPLTITV